MIIDISTFNGEHELWDIHYNALKDIVDEFRVVEFDRTFSGEFKAPTFTGNAKHYFHTEEVYGKYLQMAEESPNTVGASHWKREFMQKESIKDALVDLKDNDVVYVGDVDEVWSKDSLHLVGPVKLRLRVYTYYLNNRSTEQFWGTLKAPYGVIKELCLNHLRTDAPRSTRYMGWHFTSMGGPEALRKKLTDSYTHESYATPTVLENVGYNIRQGKDFLGREFTYTLDETEWPAYLKGNKNKYAHLCLGSGEETTQGATERFPATRGAEGQRW